VNFSLLRQKDESVDGRREYLLKVEIVVDGDGDEEGDHLPRQ